MSSTLIPPPQIRHNRATLQKYKKAQELTDRVPIREILCEPPKSRLRSRWHFVTDAARLVSLNQTEQETWEQSWIEGVPPGHDLVTNPTCPQPSWVHSTETSVRHSKSSDMWPGQMCRISLPMGRLAHHMLAPAERATGTRPKGTLLKSAHSLLFLEACDVYTKRVPPQWNGYRDCLWNCDQQQQHGVWSFGQ